MPLSQVKTWVAGEVLTAADLNNELQNIYNNGPSLVTPWSGTFDLNGNVFVIDADGDTSFDSATDDTLDFTIAGADDFRMTANTFTALSGSSITVESGNIGITSGNLTVTDGATTLADPGSHTNTTVTPLSVEATTSGTPAAGIGTGILFKSESQDENPSNVGQAEFAFSDVGAGTEDSYFQILLRVAGAALTACYRFVSTTAFKAIITHANSADRTYTLPNFDGTLATLAGTEAFTNKTITVPDASGATPTANVIYKDSLIKGFVKFTNAGTINTDYNVSSITDTGTGDWTVNWATSFASTHYAISSSFRHTSSSVGEKKLIHTNQQTGSIQILCLDDSNVAQDPDGDIHIIAVGLQ